MAELRPSADRAAIVQIGACDRMVDGNWFAQGWTFDCEHYRGPPFAPTGIAGWTWEELSAIADAEMDLARIPTTSEARP